eukprot:5467560-Pleurochrysis_carterae.AAC.2
MGRVSNACCVVGDCAVVARPRSPQSLDELDRCSLRSREAAEEAAPRAHPCGGQLRFFMSGIPKKFLRPPGLNSVLMS